MGEKIIVGPVNRGLKTDRLPFVIDNDSFPVLINAYQWRGRVKRKRGTSLLGRLRRSLTIVETPTANLTIYFVGIFDKAEWINILLTQPNASITPGSLVLTFNTAGTPTVYKDNVTLGVLTYISGPQTGSGTIDYVDGAIDITFDVAIAGGLAVSLVLNYYPDLPVMGLEELSLQYSDFPGTIAFDTVYSYNINTNHPYNIYDVSFYKNPSADPTNLPGYVPKGTWTPTTWNGQDYQQFWTTNYEGAFWATNGINVPFSITNIGMQYALRADITYVSNTPTTLVVTIAGSPLVVGDFVFVNEWVGPTAAASESLNYQSGYITSIVGPNITITFPFANIAAGPYTPGIIQYLTNRSSTTVDCIRWYDGDPTNQGTNPPTFAEGKGWVNFCPPLNNIVLFPNYSIADLPPAQYYLVGARMIVPFKDRLLFLGPVIQTSTAGSQVYLQDTIIYSQNGTPYYTASFTGDPTLVTTIFHPILLPINQTASPLAFWGDLTGFGGFLSPGISQPIITSSSNEDVLIIGFSNIQSRLVYSGNDIVPFSLFLINSELGSASTFSEINMDIGVITRGSRGYIMTSQTQCQRIDLDIPDEVFQISLQNNGNERFTSQRDFINEWIYFTYRSNQSNSTQQRFPTQTLLYNYRDNSFSNFNECYTHYGQFKRSSGMTWATLPTDLTWASWNSPWNSGNSTLFQPEVIAGNQQGFVFFKEDESTEEANSLYIQDIVGSTITSPNHCLNNTDFIIISGALGTVGNQVNGKIFSVTKATTNTFFLNPPIAAGTYLGGGYIKRMYVPFIQTKQFPVAWGMARKVRLGPQQYLLSTTDNGEITLLIFLSQNNASPYNQGSIVPSGIPINNSLVYSTVLFTCPESSNLGLTPANTNLQMVTAIDQEQIWHRMNTSLLGDTVQIGFTMSEDQMREFSTTSVTFTITGVTAGDPTVLLADNNIGVGTMVQISGVLGMTELNNITNQQNPVYIVVARSDTTISIGVDSTTFTPYISGGIVTVMELPNQFSEIELHGFILDVNPSQILA